MSLFEKPSRPAVEKAPEHQDLRQYFESYVSDAESQESPEAKEAFVDLDKIKGILSDINKGEFSSAREYLESEISRMQSVQAQEDASPEDIEEGRPYVEKITALRNSLGE